MPEKQVVIQPGMSERIDKRLLPIGTAFLLQNIRVRQGARFDKRPGVANLGVTGLASSSTAYGTWVSEMGGQPVIGVQNHTVTGTVPLYGRAYRKSADGSWTKLGRHGMVVPERRFTLSVDSLNTGKDHTCAAVNGMLFVAHSDVTNGTTTTLYAVDPSGVVLHMTTVSSASTPRLVYANSILYLVYRDSSGAGTDIMAAIVNTRLCTVGSGSAVGALAASSDIFDASAVEGGTTWLLAYRSASQEVAAVLLSGVNTSDSKTIATTAVTPSLIGISGYQGEYACIAYEDNGAVVASTLLLTDFDTIANHVIRSSAGSETYRHQCNPVRVASATFAIVMGGTDSSTYVPSAFLAHARITNGGGLTGPFKAFHVQPASKPWTVGTDTGRQVMVWAHNRTGAGTPWSLQACHYILELQPNTATGGGTNLAAISYQHIASRGASVSFLGHQPEAPLLSSGRHATVLMWDDPGALAGMDVAVWRNTVATESVSYSHRQARESGGALYISGGALYDISDGSNATETHYAPENSFPYAPELVATGVQSGGSLTAGVEYSIVGVYRSMDSRGRVHRSAPSEPVTATPTGSWKLIDVRAATLAATGRVGAIQDPPQLELYAGRNGGAHAYVGDAGAVTASVAEIDTGVSITDATLDANPALYTDQGIIETRPPDGARLFMVGGVRAFAVGWRPNVVQFSKLFVPTAPWEFCDDDTFRIFVPDEITALGWMDGAIVIFSASRVYVVTGDGPTDQGVGAYSDPRELPVTVGADSPHVVEVPAGLIYSGAGTLWLLPRGFGPPQPIGDDILDTLGRFPYLRSAVRCSNADDDVTHFTLANADVPGAETKVAIWDNRLNTWSIDDVAGEVGAAGSVGGDFTWTLPSWSSVSAIPARQLDVTQYQDYTAAGAKTWIQSRWDFGEWRPHGPLGWGRLSTLQIHGQVSGTCQINLDATCGQSGYSVAQICTVGGQRYWEHAVKYPQEGSWQFSIYDTGMNTGLPSGGAPTGMNGGIALHAVAYTHSDPEDGLRRLSDSERF